jgi:hypothetical protein
MRHNLPLFLYSIVYSIRFNDEITKFHKNIFNFETYSAKKGFNGENSKRYEKVASRCNKAKHSFL